MDFWVPDKPPLIINRGRQPSAPAAPVAPAAAPLETRSIAATFSGTNFGNTYINRRTFAATKNIIRSHQHLSPVTIAIGKKKPIYKLDHFLPAIKTQVPALLIPNMQNSILHLAFRIKGEKVCWCCTRSGKGKGGRVVREVSQMVDRFFF